MDAVSGERLKVANRGTLRGGVGVDAGVLRRSDLASASAVLAGVPILPNVTGFTIQAAPAGQVARMGTMAFHERGLYLGVGDQTHAIVGRHNECDLHLPADPTVALRELLVRVVTDASGQLALELRCLGVGRSDNTFGSDKRHHLVSATRATILAVGAYALAVVPVDRGTPGTARAPETALESLPAVSVSSVHPLDDERFDTQVWSSHVETLHTEKDHSAGSLVVSNGATEARVWISAGDLSSGILLGRYSDRCLDGGMGAFLDSTVSRTHALLIGSPDAPMLYDLASMNGCYLQSKRIRSAPLPRSGQAVALGGPSGPRVQWR